MAVPSNVRFWLVGVALAVSLFTAASAETPNSSWGQTSRFHASNVPNGSIRVGQVAYVVTRADFREADSVLMRDTLIAAKLEEALARDGSVAIVQVFCCGSKLDYQTALWVYVPRSQKVSVGDIVEIWSGKMIKKGAPLGAIPNTITGIAERAEAHPKHCGWVPNNARLWRRVIYCDWMPGAGWMQQRSRMFPHWIKPINARTPPLSSLR